MTIRNFAECLQIGQVWEAEIESWLANHFATVKPNWEVTNTKDVHRDADGDQFPDYKLSNRVSGKISFLDAKKRTAYWHTGRDPSFGFDRNYFRSYTNIAKKHNTSVFVAFKDARFDPHHLYMLDISQPHDFIWDYGANGHGEHVCYRWYVGNLKKMAL